MRDAHVVLNLLGLVGIVVGGTLPFFTATVGRSRMAARATARRLALVLAWQTVAVALAVASAVKRTELRSSAGRPLACFGELGLTGELRTVAHGDRRLAEAQKFGLTPVVEPESHETLRSAFAAALGGDDRPAAIAA